MLSQSCFNIQEFTNNESLKLCFSNDDLTILKKHPEYDLTSNRVIGRNCPSSSNYHQDFSVVYKECLSLKKIAVCNGSESSSQCSEYSGVILTKIDANKNKVSSKKHSLDLQSARYEYLPPYQKNIRECKDLERRLEKIEKKIETKQIELENTNDLIQKNLRHLNFQKLEIISTINCQVESITDKLLEVSKKRQSILHRIGELNRKISEIQEIANIKEMKNRECYFKLHQKGRQAFQFNKKLEITSSMDMTLKSQSQLHLKYLEESLHEVKNHVDELKKRMTNECYSVHKFKQPIKLESYLIKITKDCLLHFLSSVSKEERKIAINTMINTLPFDDTIKDKLLKKTITIIHINR